MKAFVTGGTGFIGRRLIDDLLAAGYEVTALVRTFDRARALPSAVRTIAGDANKPASLRLGMRGAEVVFHLAAWRNGAGVRPKDQPRLARTNVDGTRQVLELAGELGVPRIVYTSDLSVYGSSAGRLLDETAEPKSLPSDSEHQRSKYRAYCEVVRPLQRQGLPVVTVCPSPVFGPGDKSPMQALLRAYARRQLPVMFAAPARNWAYVDDVAAGHRLAAERGVPGEVYFLPGVPLSSQQFFAAAQAATGLPAPRAWLPGGLSAPLGAVVAPLNPVLAETLRGLNGPAALASGAKAEQALGWARSPLEAGLRATVDWLQAEARAEAEAAAAARAAAERQRDA